MMKVYKAVHERENKCKELHKGITGSPEIFGRACRLAGGNPTAEHSF